MKRKILLCLTAASIGLAMCSCGIIEESQPSTTAEQISDYPVDGMLSDYETDEQLLAERAYGSDTEYPYEELIQSAEFASWFSDFSERYPGAYAAKPFKTAAFSKEQKNVYQINLWYVPIMAEGRCVGIIGIDCRDGKPTADSYRSSNFLDLGKIMDKGECALFTRGSSFYGIFRDNTVEKLYDAPSNDEYSGDLTFDDLNKGYNLISPESLAEVVF